MTWVHMKVVLEFKAIEHYLHVVNKGQAILEVHLQVNRQ